MRYVHKLYTSSNHYSCEQYDRENKAPARPKRLPSKDKSTERAGGGHSNQNLTGPGEEATCQVVPERDASLSML